MRTLALRGVVFGAFRLRISGSHPWLRLVSHMANLRSRLLRLPYGDQALFMRRTAYFRVGGFRGLPLMEDVDLVRRLNRMGGFGLARGTGPELRPALEREGLFYGTLRNWVILLRFLAGAPPPPALRERWIAEARARGEVIGERRAQGARCMAQGEKRERNAFGFLERGAGGC